MFLVGGTFDESGGKASYIVAILAKFLGSEWNCINGGSLEQLASFDPKQAKVLIWMPHVDNAEPKQLDRLKAINPEMLLIQSKRVIEKDYRESDVIGRMLKSHAGLGIMITKDSEYHYRLLDPLGNKWAETTSIQTLAEAINSRVSFLMSLSRVRSHSDGIPADPPPVSPEFIELIKRFGTEFAKHVNAVNPNRLLGNTATRCTKGFPAVKVNKRIWVSRRNVNKETLSAADFVEAYENEQGELCYHGINKPSVDTPVQLKLLGYYENVNYMIHGHAYIHGAASTAEKVPCGFLEEFDEIASLVPDSQAANFSINLRGHGCLIMANDLNYLESQLTNLVSRPFPEE